MDKRILRKIRFIGQTEGESMVPVIYPKDSIYIKPATIAKLKINDIITFQQKNKLITHRIIYKKQGYFITKGDNNFQSDGKIYPGAIIGKVDKIKRNGKIFKLESLYLIQSTLYFKEIVKIKRAFEKEKIDFVLLKGLPLYLYFEGVHPHHFYFDCDILINKKDILQAKIILSKFRYRKLDMPLANIGPVIKKEKGEFSYFKKIGEFPVVFDIHTEAVFMITKIGNLEALYPHKLLDQLTEKLLENKKKIKINNESFTILNTRYLILYLSLHLFNHDFRGTFRYQLLDAIIRKNRLSIQDWQKIALKIKEYRLENFVYPVLTMIKKYYKTFVPDLFFRILRPPNSTTFKRYLKTNIFDDEPRLRVGINRFLNILLLSPNPWWKKVFIFVNPSVVYFTFWVVFKKFKTLIKN